MNIPIEKTRQKKKWKRPFTNMMIHLANQGMKVSNFISHEEQTN